MAKYLEDWSGHTLNAPPSGWTDRFGIAGNNSVVTATGVPDGSLNGRALYITSGKIYSWDALDGTGDLNILTKVWGNPTTPLDILVRHSGTANNDRNGYRLTVQPAQSGYVQVVRHAGSTFTGIFGGSNLHNNNVGTWWLVRFEVTGSTIRFKVWRESEAEPVSWGASGSDSTYTSGWVGFSTLSTVAEWWVDWISVGTNGDSPDYPDEYDLLDASAVAGAGSEYQGGTGVTQWTNPGNIVSDNGTYAVASFGSPGNPSYYLAGSSFGHSIPGNAVITGVAMGIDIRRSGGAAGTSAIGKARLSNAGTLVGVEKSPNAGFSWTSDNLVWFGGPFDTWGASLTPAQINASTFQAAIQATRTTASSRDHEVDYILLKVWYYLPPNTAPEITDPPSVNYGGYTRTGPANSPISVSFEAEDAEETGTDELTVEVRTAAAGGGTLVATDDYTSGTSGSISIAHNASGLSEGPNTLYMRVGDGTDWSDDESFTLLVDRTQPADFTPSHTPDPVLSDGEYQVTITANDSHSTGTNELTVEVRTGSGGTGTLLWTGSRTASATPFNTSTITTDSGLVTGVNNRYVRIIDGAGNIREKLLEVDALIVIEEDQDDVLAALLVLDTDESVGSVPGEEDAFPLDLSEVESIHNYVQDSLAAGVSLSTDESISSTINEELNAGVALSLDEMVSSTLEELQGLSLVLADEESVGSATGESDSFPLVMPGVELVAGTVEESDDLLLTAGLLETLSLALLVNEIDTFDLTLLSTFEEILTGLLDQENWDLDLGVTLQAVTAETSESQDLILSLDVAETPQGLVSDSDAWTFSLASSEAVQAAVVEAVTLRLAAGLLESIGIGIIERENLNLLVVAAEQISAMFTEEELLAVALGESESSSGLVRENDGSWGLSLSGVENSAGEVLEADVWALLLGVDERLSAALLEADGWNLELAVSERQMYLFHEVDNFLLTAGTDSTIQSLVSEYAEMKLMLDATGQSVAGSVVEAWQFTMVLQELERQLTNLLETENWDIEIEETLDRYWIGATPVRIGLVKLLGRALLAKLERDR